MPAIVLTSTVNMPYDQWLAAYLGLLTVYPDQPYGQKSVVHLNKKGELTSTTLTETRSNKMIFNLLTPQGFLSLSDYGTKSVCDPRDSDEQEDCGIYAPAHKVPTVITTKTDARLSLGRLAVTANARNILAHEDINTALERHKSGDWGEVGNSDWQASTSPRRPFYCLCTFCHIYNQRKHRKHCRHRPADDSGWR